MSVVAIIEPRSSGAELIVRARELGHTVLVLTGGSGARTIPERQLAHAHRVVRADTDDAAAVTALLGALHEEQPLNAVLPGFEHYVPLAARAAAALGLPGIDPGSVDGLRYKHLMRRAVATAGLDQPAFRAASSERALAAAYAELGPHCVVKPVDQSGSLGVRKVSTAAEALAAFRQALRPGGRSGPGGLRLALVEEYVQGPEYSVEGYAEGDRIHVLGITEKVLGLEPHFVEVGHIVPAQLPPSPAREIEEYITGVARALGLGLGPFHAELRMTERGPLLMEIAARLPGDRIPDLLRLAKGVDLYEIMLRAHLGQPNPQPRPAPGGGRAGIRYFLRPGLRGYQDFRVDPLLESDPRVREIGVLLPPGTELPDPGSSAGRLGYVLAAGDSYDETAGLLRLADTSVTFS
ncbi:ATP-grasp domain-containing protein [Streptomyces sp. ISL-98]|uniref:ATP-grasp domain-containing protein n=1 Tax=Streptomyces sp. ISL-98 TaxID=2819192 RepID=UPI001BE5CA37|nr:ATP-grasp domain-containing protein [Streptomyces sp. ISL-98]MBT2510067.1 ATP-grasp domain-containing protein [Streptomyces sp. ISL-98]